MPGAIGVHRFDGPFDLLVGRPLRIAVILLVAAVVAWIGRRLVRRFARRVVGADRIVAARALQKVRAPAGMLPAEDPRRAARAEAVGTVLASAVTVVVWVLAAFAVLGELDVDLGPMVAGAGIAGVALGFGAQSIVKDCLTGLFMLAEDQYAIGDVIDVGEASGTVERLTLRTTVLRGLDGTVWHVPNGEIRRVGNRSQLWSVAVVDMPIAPTADVTAARSVMAQTADRVVRRDEFASVVLDDPDVLGVESVTPTAVTMRLLVRTTPGQQFAVARALREEIQRGFEAAGIAMPAPPLAPGGSGSP